MSNNIPGPLFLGVKERADLQKEAEKLGKSPVVHQAYVFAVPVQPENAALFNGIYDDVRSWILHNIEYKDYHKYRIYLDESQTYTSISVFMSMLQDVPLKIEDIQKAVAADVAKAKWNSEAGILNRLNGDKTQDIRVFEKDSDPVHHPAHYNAYDGIEIIQLTEQMNFNKGNAVKYVCRAGLKSADTEIQDLEKAITYLNYEIARIKRKQEKESLRGAVKEGGNRDWHVAGHFFENTKGYSLRPHVNLVRKEEIALEQTVEWAKQHKRGGVWMSWVSGTSDRDTRFSTGIDANIPDCEIWMKERV